MKRSAVLGVGVGLFIGATAAWMAPVVAHENGDEYQDDPLSALGTPEPTFDPEPVHEPMPEDAISSRDELVEIEKELDPDGSPAIFVCADEGAFEFKVVQGHEVPQGAMVNPSPGPLDRAGVDPCGDYDWVVGR